MSPQFTKQLTDGNTISSFIVVIISKMKSSSEKDPCLQKQIPKELIKIRNQFWLWVIDPKLFTILPHVFKWQIITLLI